MKQKTLLTWFMFLVVVGSANFVLPSTVRFFTKAYDCPTDPTASTSGTPCNNVAMGVQVNYSPTSPLTQPLSSSAIADQSSPVSKVLTLLKQPLTIFFLIALSGTALIVILFRALRSD